MLNWLLACIGISKVFKFFKFFPNEFYIMVFLETLLRGKIGTNILDHLRLFLGLGSNTIDHSKWRKVNMYY